MLDRRIDRRRAAARSVRRRPLNSSAPRPDLVAAWAFGLGLLLILLAAATSHGQTGGTTSPATKPAGVGGPAPAVAPQLGQRVLGKGTAGEDVTTLQLILRSRGYGPAEASGAFDDATEQAVRRFQREAGLPADGLVGPQTRPALLKLMRSLIATWYGPGLYGKRTACGKRLRPQTLGVAHRSLPCGTKVTFYRDGRFVTLKVIDRGPFARGVEWDLTAAAAQRLGVRSTQRLRAVALPATAPAR